MLLLCPFETSLWRSNETWRRTTETSWRRSIETSLGVSFETYLRLHWGVQRDVAATSPRHLNSGWVVDRRAADNISVWSILLWQDLQYVVPILRSYKKTKQDNNCQIYNFSFFKCPILLTDRSRIILKKRKKCPINTTFLDNFVYKVLNISP